MKFLNWMGVNRRDMEGLAAAALRTLPESLTFIGGTMFFLLLVGGLPQ